jgi:hypothetical protein
MSNRLKAVLVGAACLICCIPLVLTVVGASAGISGAVAVWFRRYDLALIAGVALVSFLVWRLSQRNRGRR